MKPEELRKGYVGWCPYTDYLTTNKEYPSSWDNCKKYTAKEFIKEWLPFDPDFNQIIDFYFLRMTPSAKCIRCEGSGYNASTKRLSEEWYTHLRTDGKKGWQYNLNKEEIEVLWKENRLTGFKKMPTPEEVNNETFLHDAINQGICVETRAKRRGFWGLCGTCKGKGYIVTGKEYLGLNLWMSHPRKGATRGIEITHIEKVHLPIFYSLLWEAGQRLTKRFKNVPREAQISRKKLFEQGFPDIAGAMFNPK